MGLSQKRFHALALALLLAVAGLMSTSLAAAELSLLNVSYDPTRELYADYNKVFAAHWKQKTGETVTRLGMGTSWTVQPSFVQVALAAGVTYIDTAEGYEKGNSEKTIGEVLERTGKRKDVYLVTKNSSYRKITGPDAAQIFEKMSTDEAFAEFLTLPLYEESTF